MRPMNLNDHLRYLRVRGEFACFTDPLMKVERVSYPVPTPSACRGILESLYYKKEFRYEIDSVAVKNPIKFQSLRRNEVKANIGSRMIPIVIEKSRTQRNTLALKNVEYVIAFKIKFNGAAARTDGKTSSINTSEKYHNTFFKYINRGHIRRQPCLGFKEFACEYEHAEESDIKVDPGINPNQSFGKMVFDIYDLDKHSSDPKITVFDSNLIDGIVKYPTWNEIKAQYADLLNE
jgi:CRISPR-associated protein Cas5d